MFAGSISSRPRRIPDCRHRLPDQSPRWFECSCKMSAAQFLAVCSSSILAETLGYSASFSSPLHGKRRVFEGRKLLLVDQLQPSTNANKLSDLHKGTGWRTRG